MKFSVIITAHNEGVLLRSTIASVLRALRKIDHQTYEVIIHLDQPSLKTQSIAKEYQSQSSFRVAENQFEDAGLARNYAAKIACGEYLFFIDGDDLLSENYFEQTLRTLEGAHRDVVASPEFCISFSDYDKTGAVLRMHCSGTREHDAFMLFNINLWVMPIAGRREIFLRHPYIETKDGYGHEDYALNIELASQNIPHLVAPQTIYFYRQKLNSRQKWNNERQHTQPYSTLFAREFWQKFACPSRNMIAICDRSPKCILKRAYLATQKRQLISKLLSPILDQVRIMAGRMALRRNLPAELFAEWDNVAAMEPKLRRENMQINAMGSGGVNPFCPASQIYLQICRSEKGFIELDFDHLARKLDEKQKDLLMSRIMVQSRGQATFSSRKYYDVWKSRHSELDKCFGLKRK